MVWLDVTSENNSINNIYKVDTSKLNYEFVEENFRSFFLSSACNPSVKALYDQDYFFSYTIKTKNSSKEIKFDFKKDDCEAFYISQANQKNPTKEEIKNYMVNHIKEVNSKTNFPIKLDSATTWLSVKLGENSIIHSYEVSPEELKQPFTEASLKSIILPGICANSMVSVFSKHGFFLEYIYHLKDSSKKIRLKINDQECGS
jgi:hypothetical protein